MAKIVVSIPSFCDPELVPTVDNLFNKASQPDRLIVVICHQNNQEELDNVQNVFKKHEKHNQIHLINIHFEQAKGPCFARFLIQNFCKELDATGDYFLSIDSHMRFVNDWDELLIQQQKMCNTEKAIISCYPGEYKTLMDIDIIIHQSLPNLLTVDKFGSDRMLRLVGKKQTQSVPKPIACNFIAAGFYFGPIDLITDCPYPVDYDFLFFGEELLMACLFFNKGYRIFCPTMNISYHLWERSHRTKTIFQIQNNDQKLQSQQKLIDFLKNQKDFIRSISQLLPKENNPLE